jgi:hypothetical protein
VDRAALVRSEGMAAIGEMVPPRWFTPDFIARQPAAVAFVMDMLHTWLRTRHPVPSLRLSSVTWGVPEKLR